MSDSELVERLAAHRTLGSAPREQLAWVASHGTLKEFAVGEELSRPNQPIRWLYVVLSGHVIIRVDRGAGPRKVLEWRGGDVAGLLPYSRLTVPPGRVTAEEPTEVLAVGCECFPEMIQRCHELTSILVHVMLDRARRFTKSDLHDEKMLSLGRLSAGLAHELNNPASALARSAKELSSRLLELEASSLGLGAAQLSPEQFATIAEVQMQCCEPGVRNALSPLERADRQDAVADWLARHGLREESDGPLAESAVSLADLDRLANELGPDALAMALHSLGALYRVRVLTSEVEAAASRIHTLVAAVKGFTYMDQSNVPGPVAVGRGLTDTFAVLGGKARKKSVMLTLRVSESLPEVEGFGGELNQVWANLIDNAIDAAPQAGHVEVSAAQENNSIAVRVVDDGPGIPEQVLGRIFDPFFTTKPQGEGTGLGLDIARRLVQEHNGTIEVESRPGRTEFRVILPQRA